MGSVVRTHRKIFGILFMLSMFTVEAIKQGLVEQFGAKNKTVNGLFHGL